MRNYDITNYYLQIIDHWQTLIAGILAVAAGFITVKGTRRIAEMQIKEARTQIEQEQARLREQSEFIQEQDRKFVDEKLRVLYGEIEQKIKQLGSNHNSQEQVHKPTLEEVQRIPLLEMQGVEEKIARLDPPTVSDFTKLMIDIRMFSTNTSCATIIYVYDRLNKFLGQIEKIRLRILSDYDV